MGRASAELTMEERARVSHEGNALGEFAKHLRELMQSS